MPEIKGCIQGSMVLRDATFDKMTIEEFNTAVLPKVQGSWNLHDLLPQGMDFFVLLSSLSGVAGRHGQANYAVGNTYQDALARHRVAHGEKAVSLDLGYLNSVGYVAEREDLADKMRAQGFLGVEEKEVHAILDYYCNPTLPIPTPLHSQVVIGLEAPASLHARGLEVPSLMQRPLYSHLFQMETNETGSASNSEAAVNYQLLIREAETLPEIGDIIAEGVRAKLSRTLAVEKEDIDVGRPMHVYGVDSLSAVEIRTWFKTAIGADVAVFEILGNTSIATLGLAVAGKSQFVLAALREEKAHQGS